MHSFFFFFLNKILPGISSKGLNSYFDFLYLREERRRKKVPVYNFFLRIFFIKL